jgi:MFS family permease
MSIKNQIMLISGIGISNLGSWIYLIAINLFILNLTGSAAAVAGLYIIRPVAVLLTNTWAGSIIDRVNKRTLLIMVDVLRGLLIVFIPFLESIWAIYLIMLLVNIAGAFFGPASNVFITRLIPGESRKQFNAYLSMATSGSFLIGPAIAGLLIIQFNTDICMYINAASFFICALFIRLLPDKDKAESTITERINLNTLLRDWQEVILFSKTASYFMLVYLVFQTAMLLGFALDSQEATFIKNHLKLSEVDYGLITSLTGAGSLAGSFASAFFSRKLSVRMLMGLGMLFVGTGYIIFYTSSGFYIATAGFILLGFFMSFANTGYITFFQKNVPTGIMGRFGSITDMIQGLFQIILTLILGLAAELFSLYTVCLLFAIAAASLSIILCSTIYLPSKTAYFIETDVNTIS